MEKQHLDLGEGKLGRLLLRFSTPCVISLLITSLYNLVDQLFIGNAEGLGVIGNSATTIVFPLTILALALALLIGDGLASYLSRCQGEGNIEKAEKAMGAALIIALVLSGLFTLFGLVFLEDIIRMLGANEENFEMSLLYGRIIIAGIVFSIFTNVLNPIIRSDGSPFFAMIAQGSGALVNIILDPIFLFVFKMGIEGAAYATIIGQAVSAVLSVVYLFRTKTFRIKKDGFVSGWKYVLKPLALGISSFFIQMSLVVVTIMSNVVLGNVATGSPTPSEAQAVFGIAFKVFTIVVNIGVGIALGGVPIIAYNYGAKKYRRCVKTYNLVLLSTLAVMVVATLVFQLFPNGLVSLFGSDTSESYKDFAVRVFRIYLSLVILTGTQRTSSIYFQALGKPVIGSFMSLLRDFFLLVPLTFALSYGGLGLDGFLLASPISDLVAFLVTALFVGLSYRSLLKKEKEETVSSELRHQSA